MLDPTLIIELIKAISLFATAIASILALREYKLKVSAERRETDIRIMQLFTETVRMAQSRGSDHFSEKFIEQLFEKRIVTKKDFESFGGETSKILYNKLQASVIHAPTSEASQNAAIIALAVLGKRYREILDQPARVGLKTIKENNEDQKKQAEEALAYLNAGKRVSKAA